MSADLPKARAPVVTVRHVPVNHRQAKASWWELSGDELARKVRADVGVLEEQQRGRIHDQILNYRLYENKPWPFWAVRTSMRISVSPQATVVDGRLKLNVIKSVTQTAAATIAENRPRPQFLTEEGDYAQQERAKGKTRFVDGVFYANDTYEQSGKVFFDAIIAREGYWHVYAESGEVKTERVPPVEVLVDAIDGASGKPRELHRRYAEYRRKLLRLYPEREKEILAAERLDVGGLQTTSDMVLVTKSWALPWPKKDEDGEESAASRGGKWALSLGDTCLEEGVWERDELPFVRYQWDDFSESSIADELRGLQLEINDTLRDIARAQQIAAVPRVFVEKGSGVNKAQITNHIGAVIEYATVAPTFSVSEAMPPEVYSHLWQLFQKAYEITGVSMQSATGVKPAGLDSAVAQREFNDIGSKRFILNSKRFEDAHMKVARLVVAEAEALSKAGRSPRVKAVGSGFLQIVKWDDVALDEDKYLVKVFPVSALPSTPAGKLQTVQELVQSGFISKEYAFSLLQFPDLDDFVSLETSALDVAKKIVDVILREGRYIAPEPYQDLQVSMKIAVNAYLRAKAHGDVKDQNLGLLRRYMKALKELLQAPPPGPPAGPGLPPGPGPGPGAPPPMLPPGPGPGAPPPPPVAA